tara:strand:- start:311 stop:610 length:300 start_codon:yes stop_codon:yes gene_type:complete
MEKVKNNNLTKKEISNFIATKIGLSNNYTEIILNDLITIFCELIKNSNLNISNFGKFKTISKVERVGRNPKNKIEYKIAARKAISFIPSKKLVKRFNNN